jgi:monoamine oxidase
VPKPLREFAVALVQGFDAADPARISAREVLEEWSGPAAAGGSTFRPVRGYGAMLEYMQRTLRPDRVTLQLGAVVRAVAWRKGHVEVAAERLGAPLHLRAKRAIITLPLGVLQLPETAAGFVRFSPALNVGTRNAIAHLAAGPVIKLALTFTRPFWEDVNAGRYCNAAFFHAPLAVFPTFWTSLPARTSTLIAWTGGPNAARLAGLGAAGIIACALQSLQAIFGRRDLAASLENVAWHDWQRDRYARGAYSYVLAQGANARQALARPIQQTLYFAGEACDTGGEAATVAGALRSGADAARQALN